MDALEKDKILIDGQEVETIFMDCLYRKEELEGIQGVPKNAVIVEGILSKFVFHPDRLEEKQEKVKEWLKALPHQFHKNDGGGWSFLNACRQENGVQWTGLHERMGQLFCLGMGLDLVECLLPRELWSALPGGVPYYVVDVH